jgi:hypothetical protein
MARTTVGANTRAFAIASGGTQSWTDVPPGTYVVTWSNAECGLQGGCGNQVTWGPQTATQSVTVIASTTATAAAMTYVPKTGIIRLSVSGIPTSGTEGGNSALMHLTISDGRAQRDWLLNSGTVDINDVPPGSYTLAWDTAACGYQGGCGRTYVPTASSQTITVTASITPVVAAMAYKVAGTVPVP